METKGRTNRKSKKVEFEQVIERGCGIDVHKKVLVATISGHGLKPQTREFGSFTEDIQSLVWWLQENEIRHVAMESTGVYWKPVYNIMEEHFTIILVNPRSLKAIPGKKTDKKDSQRIAKYLLAGLLKSSFIPARGQRELRDLTRYKRKVVGHIASEKNRFQKFLEDANIKLSSVVSDMDGAVATKIIDGLLSGEERAEELAKNRHGRMHASVEQLTAALRGELTDHHRFMLEMVRASIADKQARIKELDEQIDKKIAENAMTQDVELLSTIPGVDKESAHCILAEIGNNMEHFPNEHHLSSWAGLSPGNNESGGKKKSGKTTHGDKWLRSMLVQCAWGATRTKNTYLRSKYESLVGRRGKKRALIAVAHKQLIAIYYILRDKAEYKELGGDFLNKRNKDKNIKRHLQKLRELGVDVSQVAA